ncbi:bone morphogenetic protein 2 [Plakobranchus ocellatus]|uniref:Bone morphogenetic protein 2 n=1 Tax=Plakobranchus ocellatus TaxID=259542 RepID=A0AAV4A9F7_9GAST|nr:bone morphogenetic protein 2 [Plakobranchus ocellatus]
MSTQGRPSVGRLKVSGAESVHIVDIGGEGICASPFLTGALCSMTGDSRCWLSLLLLLTVLISRLLPLDASSSSPSPPTLPPPVKTFPPDPPIPPNIDRHGSSPIPPRSALAILYEVTTSPSSSSSSHSSSSDSSFSITPVETPDAKDNSLVPSKSGAGSSKPIDIGTVTSVASSTQPSSSSSSSPSRTSSYSSHPEQSYSSEGDSANAMKISQDVNAIPLNDDSKNAALSTSTNNHHSHHQHHDRKGNSLTPKSRSRFSEKDAKLLQAVEQMFLKNSGLRQRPNVQQDWVVPDYMLDLYRAQLDTRAGTDTSRKLKGRGHVAANTVRSFVHKDTESEGCRPPLCSRIRFDISTVSEEETLTGAELRIFVGEGAEDSLGKSGTLSARQGAVGSHRQPRGDGSSLARLEIHQIIKPASSTPTSTSSLSSSSSSPQPSGDEAITRLLDTRVVDARNASWHSFDVHPAVLRWKRLGRTHNHGLEIRLMPVRPGRSQSPTRAVSSGKDPAPDVHLSTDSHVRVRRAAHLPDRDWTLQKPLLVTFTDDGFSPPLFPQSSSFSSSSSSKTKTSSFTSSSSSSARRSKVTLSRRRRSAGNKKDSADKGGRKKRKKNRRKNRRRRKRKRLRWRKKKGNKNICQRHALYVDFRDVGWDDWIVAPTGYSAYFCRGDCIAPIPDFAKASNHAMLQARVYKVNPSAVPMVCCVPIKMAPISMLYRDENEQTVLKNYQDMSVDECGCK